MAVLESVKERFEKVTGWARPSARDLDAALRPRKAPAAIFEELFERNGWGDSWRNGIYDYAHYHSRIHEVLGVARGHPRIRFGGAKGRALKLKAADVVILPAGTGHERLSGSKDLLG
jgi:uncharacterized protein YjlB